GRGREQRGLRELRAVAALDGTLAALCRRRGQRGPDLGSAGSARGGVPRGTWLVCAAAGEAVRRAEEREERDARARPREPGEDNPVRHAKLGVSGPATAPAPCANPDAPLRAPPPRTAPRSRPARPS